MIIRRLPEGTLIPGGLSRSDGAPPHWWFLRVGPLILQWRSPRQHWRRRLLVTYRQKILWGSP